MERSAIVELFVDLMQQMNFGWVADEKESFAVMDRALEAGINSWSPVGGGLLGGVLQKQKEGRRAAAHVEEQVEKKRPQLEQWEAFCAQRGHQPADVRLRWSRASAVRVWLRPPRFPASSRRVFRRRRR